MKKLLKIIFITMLCFSVSACSSKTITNGDANKENEQVSNDTNTEDKNGQVGDDIYWELDGNTLNIHGTGKMNIFWEDEGESYEDRWNDYDNDIEIVNIGEGITSITSCAFLKCENIKEINISSTVNSIEMDLEDCQKLESINIDPNSKYFYVEDNILYSYNHELVICMPNYTGKVVIPEGITTIKAGAFNECKNITEVDMPDSITKLGSNMFLGCTKLKKIISSNNIKELPAGAFCCCDNLSSITLPESLETIKKDVFSFCYSLEEITIPASTTKISSAAFSDTLNLKTINVDKNNKIFQSIDGVLYKGTTLVYFPLSRSGKYSVKEGTKKIADYAFENCKLSSITLPDSVEEIGDYSFSDSTLLTNVQLSDNLKKIGYWAFSYCSSLTHIDMPEGVEVEDYAFSGTKISLEDE